MARRLARCGLGCLRNGGRTDWNSVVLCNVHGQGRGAGWWAREEGARQRRRRAMTGGWWGSHGGQLQRAQVTSTAARNINTKDVISDLLPSLKSLLAAVDDRCAHLHRQRPPAAVARPHPPCSTPSTSTPAVHLPPTPLLQLCCRSSTRLTTNVRPVCCPLRTSAPHTAVSGLCNVPAPLSRRSHRHCSPPMLLRQTLTAASTEWAHPKHISTAENAGPP